MPEDEDSYDASREGDYAVSVTDADDIALKAIMTAADEHTRMVATHKGCTEPECLIDQEETLEELRQTVQDALAYAGAEGAYRALDECLAYGDDEDALTRQYVAEEVEIRKAETEGLREKLEVERA